jgi:sugar phosphate isomerase/epimerase
MEISCSSPMVPGRSLTEQADDLHRWGFDAISVFTPYSGWSDAVQGELASLHTQTGVRPCEFVLIDDIYGHAMDTSPDLRAQCRAMYSEAASVCAQLGLITEIEYEYGPQNPMPLFDPYQQLDRAQKAGFVSFYRELLEIVAGSDGSVLIEPLNRYESRYLNTVADSAAIVSEANHPNAGLLLDVFHMSIEERSIPEAIIAAGALARHVHLADNNRLLPGLGDIDWPAVFTAFREIAFDGVLNLECSTSGDPEQTLPRAVGFLRELLAT